MFYHLFMKQFLSLEERNIPIMTEKLNFMENQRFQFKHFEAAHNVLWAMQKRSKRKMLIFCRANSSFMIGIKPKLPPIGLLGFDR